MKLGFVSESANTFLLPVPLNTCFMLDTPPVDTEQYGSKQKGKIQF